jgi:hypothetical protein
MAAIAAGGVAGLLGAAGLAFAFVFAPAAGPGPSASPPAAAMASGDMASMQDHAIVHGSAPVGPAGTETPSAMPSMDMSMPTPTLGPPNKLAPVGGKVVIGGYALVTTARGVIVQITPEPYDRDGVTHMKVSNYPTRPPAGARPYAAKFSWTLLDGVAGRRTVYVWFRDGTGNWTTNAVIDNITFDHNPRAVSGVAFHAHMFGDCPGIAANGYVQVPLLPSVGRDADGAATLKITRAWDMDTNVQWSVEPGGQAVRVAVTPRTGFPERVITGMFVLSDDHEQTDQGSFLLHVGPC